MSGFSPRNIKYMRKFTDCWQDIEIVKHIMAQIPRRINRMLLEKLDSRERCLWCVNKMIENGWGSNVLDLQIQGRIMERTGRILIISNSTSSSRLRYGE